MIHPPLNMKCFAEQKL